MQFLLKIAPIINMASMAYSLESISETYLLFHCICFRYPAIPLSHFHLSASKINTFVPGPMLLAKENVS